MQRAANPDSFCRFVFGGSNSFVSSGRYRFRSIKKSSAGDIKSEMHLLTPEVSLGDSAGILSAELLFDMAPGSEIV